MIQTLARLRAAGVLGINARNNAYTLRWNPRRLYPMVDDKLATKRMCTRAGIPVPRLLTVARHHFEVRELLQRLAGEETFVLKPARGAMGNGIMVVFGRAGDHFLGAGERRIEAGALAYHAAGIISGLYALGGQSDVAMVEERLDVHPAFADLVYRGVPDVRVIVYRGVPIMAMTRLPTRRSAGRANLHQGAIGAGIDLATGRTRYAILRNRLVTHNRDTGKAVVDVPIPEFARALEIAVRATDETGLGYVGADVVVDEARGPVILELNARPGLAVQIANRQGLRPRLDAVDAGWKPGRSVAERVALGREIAETAGRQVRL